eukprot:scaffold105400_cov30-Tisochrysis_lutea.AAC.2
MAERRDFAEACSPGVHGWRRRGEAGEAGESGAAAGDSTRCPPKRGDGAARRVTRTAQDCRPVDRRLLLWLRPLGRGDPDHTA